MHSWVLRDAAVPLNGCCFLAKFLEYCNSSVFIITTIMTMTPIKDIYFTSGLCWSFLLVGTAQNSRVILNSFIC